MTGHTRASSEPEDVQKLHERVPVPQEGPESVHTEELADRGERGDG